MASLDGSDGHDSPATVSTTDDASPTAQVHVAPASTDPGAPTPVAGGPLSSTSSTSPAVRSTSSFHVSKRAPKACGNCHRRKANPPPPGSTLCSTYQKTKKRLAAQQAALSVPGQPPSLSKPSGSGTDQRGRQRRQSDSRTSGTSYHPTRSVLSPKDGESTYTPFPPHKDPTLVINPSLSDEHVWVQFLDKVHDNSGTGGGLEQQLTAQSTPSNYRQRPDDYQQTRDNSTDREQEGKRQVLIFNGETALDGAVPTIAGLQSMPNGQNATLDPHLDSSLSLNHVPSFSPPPSWTTVTNRAHVADLKIISDDDKSYLLDHKKVHIFPAIGTCDKLIKIFFQYIYPHLPILNRPAFIRGYRKMLSGDGIYSLFLMHAVLYAATYHAPTEILKECGFENRLTARAYFFSRAKLVHMMDGEKEHLYTIQGCTLMSMWWTRYEEEKETRFWLQAAVLLSQRMGMHRSIRTGWGLGASERRMWKRIWWTLYSRDHITASSLGKPSLIRISDCDVGDLEEDDFIENWGTMDQEEVAMLCPPQQSVNIRYAIEIAKLGKIYERIASIQYSCTHRPSLQDLEDIASDLTNWKNDLPLELSTLRYDEMRTWTSENFWPILLQLVHDRAVSMHYRPRCSRPKGRAAWETDGRSPDEETLMKDREKARKAVVSAASNTFRLIEDLLRHDLLKFAPAAVQTPLFIAMIVYAEEIKLAPEGSTRHSLATNKITLGMMALGELRKIWAASSWTFRLFEFIIKNKFVGIGKPEISVGGGAGVPPDVAAHTGLNPHNPHGGMHPVDDADVINNHSQIPELAIDPQLDCESGPGGSAASGIPQASGPPNHMPNSATTTPGGPMSAAQPMFWNPANTETLSPDAAGHVMWNGQHPEMMQQHHHPGPDGWGYGGSSMGGMADGAGEEAGGFDLTWLAMSGLAGNMPFHNEGGPIMGAGSAIGYNGAPDIAKLAQGGINPHKMGATAIDLWNILGLGDSSGYYG
ncbi:hypothetical protein H072_108 [Dactylellina haptotyla CBS 200.50]|uniref:Xylanolytic transcriptional activator regulatory domain-containing protein n=1 Tax=Dactylellina haptotyla (strain CBS 200.50) TaxID=1284197 RepID=S8CE37_DACHA|nr:hypothetical protein H072_108 [Dactylellina haptotyla CBS 200.50]